MLITGKTTTTVGHYKDAAERHLHVCRILLEQLNDPKIIANVNKYQNILAELYYLSGYIVECTINYKYLQSKNFLDFHNHKPNPNQNRRWDNGVDLHLHFRFIDPRALSSSKVILGTFPSNTLPNYLKTLGGIPVTQTLVGQDLIKEKMQKHWDPKVRYAYESTGLLYTSATPNDIKLYHEAAEDLFKTI